jgi:hypothetical protein
MILESLYSMVIFLLTAGTNQKTVELQIRFKDPLGAVHHEISHASDTN